MSTATDRLRKRADFIAAQRGARAHAGAFVLQSRDRGDDAGPRFGLTITKKVGTAVERNRVRRRLRAIVRQEGAAARPGFDYVVVARRDAINAPFAELAREFSRTLSRVHAADRRGRSGRAAPARTGDDRDER
ncbi:ribonuclease P protein component [Blastochloris sulfoviridis]|uniref:Ribonuclease P protein component n=1 Tax=Blastochloris sulfoviridis TaxID=50712 RepID=A0A5M6I255_9HYPH|nr:ribonuclease P protein component [Blastochloris sulfoviridis]KAA5601905.1 ribonuclease P protein component [Blastochloris sulfoviridis]